MKNSYLFNSRGFALVEILVALTVLTITIASFSILFSHSYSGIFSAGYKSNSQYISQDKMENGLLDPSSCTAEEGFTVSTDNLTIDFPGLSEQTVIPGKNIILDEDYTDGNSNARTVIVTSFVPDR